jgi:tryptophan-rich sensory protein
LTTYSLRTSWPLLLLFLALVMGIGFVVGLVSAPGPWFATLAKPDAFIIPDWLNSLIWALLCVAFAVAGWRLWLQDSSSVEMRLWLAILILSWWFSPVFFLVRSPLIAFAVIAVLLLMMVAFIFRAWDRERVCAWLFVPCSLYILYVAVMTGAIVWMN